MIEIVDTYEEIKALLAQGGFDMERWKRYAAAVAPGLPALIRRDIQEYDFERQILPVIRFFYAHEALLDEAHASFVQITKDLSARSRDVNSQVIFYMGLCSGAGWATVLDGVPAVLLGAEKIVELHWTDRQSMAGLIYHELGHQWHFQHRTAAGFAQTPRGQALWQLYTEGVAMYFEQELYGEAHFYHQDRGGWLCWCEERRAELARAYLRRLDAGGAEDFFGDWRSYEGHSDVGYYLGAQLARRAAETRGVKELLNMTARQAEKELKMLAGVHKTNESGEEWC